MLRFGAIASEMRSLRTEDLFVARLKLLIIMCQAYLDEYPVGRFRRQAVINNANQIAKEALEWDGRINRIISQSEYNTDYNFEHIFLQRVKLLAVMAKSFAQGNPMGHYRMTALRDNIDYISRIIMFYKKTSELGFIKVA
ncbi:MAG: hypothetical protein HQK77_08195 [Desulfobacterales bacterium]|nr:hypothetical protein [Desulfobacterales bacterium]